MGASLDVNQIPGIGAHVDATLNANNILRSDDRKSSLDAYASNNCYMDRDDASQTNLGVRGNANLWSSDNMRNTLAKWVQADQLMVVDSNIVGKSANDLNKFRIRLRRF